jgi:ketosteroid isomerase-like protein
MIRPVTPLASSSWTPPVASTGMLTAGAPPGFTLPNASKSSAASRSLTAGPQPCLRRSPEGGAWSRTVVPGLPSDQDLWHLIVKVMRASIKVEDSRIGVSSMKATDEFAHQELTQRVEDYRTAYQDRDLERMLAMFADDAVMFWSQGMFRGKAAIRTVLAQDVRECSTAVVRDTGLGMLAAGRSVVWERQVSLTVKGVPVLEDAVTILEFDDAGQIRQFRSYYDKLGMMNQIASGLPGIYGWFARKVVGSVVAQANKGLDTSSA